MNCIIKHHPASSNTISHNFTSFHIISHPAPHCVYLPRTTLTNSTVDKTPAKMKLTAWRWGTGDQKVDVEHLEKYPEVLFCIVLRCLSSPIRWCLRDAGSPEQNCLVTRSESEAWTRPRSVMGCSALASSQGQEGRKTLSQEPQPLWGEKKQRKYELSVSIVLQIETSNYDTVMLFCLAGWALLTSSERRRNLKVGTVTIILITSPVLQTKTEDKHRWTS